MRRIAEVATTGDVNWVMSVSAVAGTRSICRFAAFIASWHRRTRSSGSAQFVGQFGDDARHPVGPRVFLVAGADRHRHHRPQRLVGQGVVLDQVLAQRAGTDRHHDVVDRASGGVLERLDVVERRRTHREPAVRRDRLAPRRRRAPASAGSSPAASSRRTSPPVAIDVIVDRACEASPLMLVSPAAEAMSRTRRSWRRRPFSGFEREIRRASVCSISRSLGIGSPVHGTGSSVFDASGSVSVSMLSRITPDAPSIVE